MKHPSFWRHAALALLAINLLFWMWTQGYLRLLGVGPQPAQEPERLSAQLHPEAMTLKPAASAARQP
jgi:hypothetical protein